MSSRDNLRQHTCQYCQRRSIMIIYNHEQTCAKNPNRAYNIAKRYGGRHVSGADLSSIISRRRLAAGLERPAASATPSMLTIIGLDQAKPLPILVYGDLEAALVPDATQVTSEPTALSVPLLSASTPNPQPPVDTPPGTIAVSVSAAGLPSSLEP